MKLIKFVLVFSLFALCSCSVLSSNSIKDDPQMQNACATLDKFSYLAMNPEQSDWDSGYDNELLVKYLDLAIEELGKSSNSEVNDIGEEIAFKKRTFLSGRTYLYGVYLDWKDFDFDLTLVIGANC